MPSKQLQLHPQAQLAQPALQSQRMRESARSGARPLHQRLPRVRLEGTGAQQTRHGRAARVLQRTPFPQHSTLPAALQTQLRPRQRALLRQQPQLQPQGHERKKTLQRCGRHHTALHPLQPAPAAPRPHASTRAAAQCPPAAQGAELAQPQALAAAVREQPLRLQHLVLQWSLVLLALVVLEA